jgi:hypothetical protein
VPAIITARLAAAPSIEDLQEVLHSYREQLNCIHLSAGFTRLAKLPCSSSADKALLQQVAGFLNQQLAAASDDLGTRELANVVWALGKLSWQAPARPALLSSLVAKSISSDGHLERASPQQLSSLANGFASLGCKQRELWSAIWAAMDNKLAALEPRQLTNALWALAKAGFSDASATAKLLDAIASRFSSLGHASYLQLAWAIAELGPRQCQLASVLAAACARDVKVLDQRALTQAIHMCAKVQVDDEASIHRLLTAALRMPERFTTSELATIVRAAGTLQHRDTATVAKLLHAAVLQTKRLTAQQISTLITSVAMLNYLPQDATKAAMQQLVSALQHHLPGLSAADVSGCLSSCAKLLHCRDDAFIAALCNAAGPLVPSMDARMLSNTLWACATLRVQQPDLLQAVEAAVLRGDLHLTGQALAVSFWAASQLYPAGGPVMVKLVAAVRSEADKLLPMDIVQVAFALAQAHVKDPELYSVLVQQSSKQLQAFDGHMLVALAASLQRARALTQEFVSELAQHRSLYPAKWPAADVGKLQQLTTMDRVPAENRH